MLMPDGAPERSVGRATPRANRFVTCAYSGNEKGKKHVREAELERWKEVIRKMERTRHDVINLISRSERERRG